MAVYGSISTMNVADLLQWMDFKKKTGTLTITYGPLERKIHVEGGTVRFASSNNPREKIGQYLVKSGILSEQELLKALEEQERTGSSLGDILIRMGRIERGEFEHLLERVVKEIIYSSLLLEEGNFHFEEEKLPSFPVDLRLPIPDLLFEGFRRLDEWKVMKKVFPSTRARVRFLQEPEDDPVVRRIYQLAGSGLSIENMAYELRMSEFELCKILHRLHREGKIEVLPAEKEETELDLVEKLRQLRQQLQELESRGELDRAIEVVERMLELDPASMELYAKLRSLREARQTAHINEDAVPRIKVSPSQLTRLRVDAKEGFVLSRINGVLTVGQIIKICPFLPYETKKIIAGLASRGIIELV